MDPTTVHIAGLAAAARTLKESIVAEGGIGSDVPNLLALGRGDEILGLIALGTISPSKDMLPSISLAVALTRADHAVSIAECYMEGAGSGDLSVADGPIDLSSRFAAGDQSVVEAINVVGVSRDGHASMMWCPYRYDGRRVVWFDDGVAVAGENGAVVDGAYVHAIRRGLDAEHVADEPMTIETVGFLLGVAAFSDFEQVAH